MALITPTPAMGIIRDIITLGRRGIGGKVGRTAVIILIVITIKTIITAVPSPTSAQCLATATKAVVGQVIMGVTTTTLAKAAGKGTITSKGMGVVVIATTKITEDISNISLADKPFLITLNHAFSLANLS
jgi:hypothetical protein